MAVIEVELQDFQTDFLNWFQKAEAGEEIRIVKNGQPQVVLLSTHRYLEMTNLILNFNKRIFGSPAGINDPADEL